MAFFLLPTFRSNVRVPCDTLLSITIIRFGQSRPKEKKSEDKEAKIRMRSRTRKVYPHQFVSYSYPYCCIRYKRQALFLCPVCVLEKNTKALHFFTPQILHLPVKESVVSCWCVAFSGVLRSSLVLSPWPRWKKNATGCTPCEPVLSDLNGHMCRIRNMLISHPRKRAQKRLPPPPQKKNHILAYEYTQAWIQGGSKLMRCLPRRALFFSDERPATTIPIEFESKPRAHAHSLRSTSACSSTSLLTRPLRGVDIAPCVACRNTSR